jgi:hypothetical protein
MNYELLKIKEHIFKDFFSKLNLIQLLVLVLLWKFSNNLRHCLKPKRLWEYCKKDDYFQNLINEKSKTKWFQWISYYTNFNKRIMTMYLNVIAVYVIIWLTGSICLFLRSPKPLWYVNQCSLIVTIFFSVKQRCLDR